MRALEDLLNEVRDRESRRYLEEAVRAYNVGAFRAAIVVTWVAVAFDLISKIRQLAANGDAAANDFTRRLDQAIEGDNTGRLLTLERELLTVAQGTFEFIERRELKELERLHDDRHVCAHPAFVRPSEVFEPPPELVRAHIATAVDTVLSKGPTPGRRAIERFKEEIRRDSFPRSQDDLTRYLRAQYFEPGKSSLRRGLAALIVKACLESDETGTQPRVTRRYAMAARALERIEPGLLTDALSTVVTRREEGPGLSDDDLLRFTANLGDMALAWQALPDASHVKVYETLKNADVQQLVDQGIFACALIAEAREAVDVRLEELDDVQLSEVIGQDPDSRRFGASAIAALQQSRTNDAATRIMDTLVLPLARTMTHEQVRSVLTCLQDNPQVRMAADMPPMFTEFFDRTGDTFASCYDDWLTLVQWLADTAPHRDSANHFAYPELWARVLSATSRS
jgi:hypothetical protein